MSATEILEDPVTPVVRVGVGVLLLSPGGYVLMQRQGSHGAGEWSFPGGHLEFSETVLDCARREVAEELGVTLKDPCTVPLFTEDFFPKHQRHYITVYVTGWCEETPRILEPEKCSQLKMVPLGDSLPAPTFPGVGTVWEYKSRSIIKRA
jgi:8-oxo-dGTP diphosphatase